MKILMLCEYFMPFDIGGSEWSVYYLAKKLVNLGFEISVLTPNYQSAKKIEVIDGILINRFNVFTGFGNKKKGVTPFWQTNLYWQLICFVNIYRQIKSNKVDLIHIQGKYFLPSAYLVAKLLKIPLIFTARDYIPICSLGFCLWEKTVACDIRGFLDDVKFFYNNYSIGSTVKKIFLFPFLIRSKIISKILKVFAKSTDKVICISKAQQNIYKCNGFTNVVSIYNTIEFPDIISGPKRKNQIIYCGRLTKGKGAHLLIPIFKEVFKKVSNYTLLIIGRGLLKKQITQDIRSNKLENKIILKDHLDHNLLLKLYAQAKYAVFPSLWPEPFGRGPLEALSYGCRVIVSHQGGLPEISRVAKCPVVAPDIAEFQDTIISLIKREFIPLTPNTYKSLKNIFYEKPIGQYIKLYRSLL